MSDRRVLSMKYLPARLPLWPTALTWLMLDYYDAGGWVHGVVWTLWGLLWVGYIVALCQQRPMEPTWKGDAA